MVNLNPFNRNKREAIQILHGQGFQSKALLESNKGQTSHVFGAWTDKLPHPTNMNKYATWACDPQVRIGIDLKTDMVASEYYLQMPEKDLAGKEIDAEHKNLAKCKTYLKDIGFADLYKQIQRQKYEMGFSCIEVLEDKSLKLLPSDSIYMWKKPTESKPYRVTKNTQRTT